MRKECLKQLYLVLIIHTLLAVNLFSGSLTQYPIRYVLTHVRESGTCVRERHFNAQRIEDDTGVNFISKYGHILQHQRIACANMTISVVQATYIGNMLRSC